MRPSAIEYLLLSVCIVVAVVSAVAVFSSTPPVPYVRLDDTRVAPIYLLRVECVGGEQAYVYAREGGEEIPAVLTGRAC